MDAWRRIWLYRRLFRRPGNRPPMACELVWSDDTVPVHNVLLEQDCLEQVCSFVKLLTGVGHDRRDEVVAAESRHCMREIVHFASLGELLVVSAKELLSAEGNGMRRSNDLWRRGVNGDPSAARVVQNILCRYS